MAHSLWITNKGKIIDISKQGLEHFEWAVKNLKKLPKYEFADSEFASIAKSGYIRVSNSWNLEFHGRKKDLKKHRKLIQEIIDYRLFHPKMSSAPFSVWFELWDDEGSKVGEDIFEMPEEDTKLKRYL